MKLDSKWTPKYGCTWHQKRLEFGEPYWEFRCGTFDVIINLIRLDEYMVVAYHYSGSLDTEVEVGEYRSLASAKKAGHRFAILVLGRALKALETK